MSYSESAPPSGPGLDQHPMGAHRSSSATQSLIPSPPASPPSGDITLLCLPSGRLLLQQPPPPPDSSVSGTDRVPLWLMPDRIVCHLPPQESRPVHSLALDSSHLHVPHMNPCCPHYNLTPLSPGSGFRIKVHNGVPTLTVPLPLSVNLALFDHLPLDFSPVSMSLCPQPWKSPRPRC